MDGFLLFVMSVVPVILIPAGFAWAVTRARRRGLGGSVVGPFQEMWDPGAARTRVEIEVRAEQKAPAPSPGDPLSSTTTGVRPDR
ncbi:hypothetical protein ACL02S_15290 [Nocardia sp. 004]|uniref:hypothetical protein n=1 Tax=Nocardia sp. 004 TaxID=3385978 RepID=UPI00399FDAF3